MPPSASGSNDRRLVLATAKPGSKVRVTAVNAGRGCQARLASMGILPGAVIQVVRGASFSPLYKLAPGAAERDSKLYELLALVDGIRGGRAREREIAIKELKQRLGDYG